MVRTRFAPSPTGFLHIGGVRTALFNWLYARRHGGKFVLRIDDTDRERNVEAALAPILHGFRWLGIDWDEGAEVGGPHGPYHQSMKLGRYHEAARTLVDRGLAYFDYATPEEIQRDTNPIGLFVLAVRVKVLSSDAYTTGRSFAVIAVAPATVSCTRPRVLTCTSISPALPALLSALASEKP